MRKACLTVLGTMGFLAAPAFADTPLCLTINNPGKWGAGLILQIDADSAGGNTVSLKSASMFRGATSESLGSLQSLGIVRGVSRKSDGGKLIIEGGVSPVRIYASLGEPDQYGGLQGEINLQLGDLEIHTRSASVTRFTGNGKCE